MTNNNKQLFDEVVEEPSLIFTLIKQEKFEIIEKLINTNNINVNLEDNLGNDLVTRLLKSKQYDLVLKLMKKKNWDVNHQNEEKDTFGHILAQDDSVQALQIVEQLKKKKNYIPDIKNKKGKTALDIALNNNHLYTAFKILEDKRFNNIDISLFKKIYNICIKTREYGKYSKINNLEIIVENLEKKNLEKNMADLISTIYNNMEEIKKDIMNNKISLLESIINNYV